MKKIFLIVFLSSKVFATGGISSGGDCYEACNLNLSSTLHCESIQKIVGHERPKYEIFALPARNYSKAVTMHISEWTNKDSSKNYPEFKAEPSLEFSEGMFQLWFEGKYTFLSIHLEPKTDAKTQKKYYEGIFSTNENYGISILMEPIRCTVEGGV